MVIIQFTWPKLTRPLLYLWALPTTLVGAIFIPLALITGGKFQIVTGVLEIHGGAVTWFLSHGTFLRGGASAMTLGHIVLARNRQLLDSTRSHERVHVKQCERWGPLFLPAYAIASIIAVTRGGSAYSDNAFEREAYEQDV